MTIQEAIDLQKELMKYCIDMDYTHSDYTSACDEILELNVMVCKALEKQIPKKPIGDGIYRYCPVCSRDVGYIDAMAEEKLKYCNNCGQAIDWRDAK